jgi:hypothetical protein
VRLFGEPLDHGDDLGAPGCEADNEQPQAVDPEAEGGLSRRKPRPCGGFVSSGGGIRPATFGL